MDKNKYPKKNLKNTLTDKKNLLPYEKFIVIN